MPETFKPKQSQNQAKADTEIVTLVKTQPRDTIGCATHRPPDLLLDFIRDPAVLVQGDAHVNLGVHLQRMQPVKMEKVLSWQCDMMNIARATIAPTLISTNYNYIQRYNI